MDYNAQLVQAVLYTPGDAEHKSGSLRVAILTGKMPQDNSNAPDNWLEINQNLYCFLHQHLDRLCQRSISNQPKLVVDSLEYFDGAAAWKLMNTMFGRSTTGSQQCCFMSSRPASYGRVRVSGAGISRTTTTSLPPIPPRN